MSDIETIRKIVDLFYIAFMLIGATAVLSFVTFCKVFFFTEKKEEEANQPATPPKR